MLIATGYSLTTTLRDILLGLMRPIGGKQQVGPVRFGAAIPNRKVTEHGKDGMGRDNVPWFEGYLMRAERTRPTTV
ncbi:hypothetical protein NEOLI_005502 [Neolecta irregularis DAH-3]|uniref:Uncharacterized protein n=1 Tax=Neolecta irregularis (strain DAH-3) TaxID=1198029 RepID=A0A1U7LM95_NEOID|nr:hypothetical protein NEOLI_005502 [Neolecta irregularis DAH-3]|eukprot:OLL23767.1 hypothetical protein NEOLI_005502 [Neolecta irregularis DAH-3]